VSVSVTPYQSGELRYSSQSVPDTILFSNGISVYVLDLAAQFPGTYILEDCIEEPMKCLVARSSGSFRSGAKHSCVGGDFNYCYYPSYGIYENALDPSPAARDSALLIFADPGGLGQPYPFAYGDTIWDQALVVPDSLYDSSVSMVRRPSLFGVPVFFREARCTGTLSRCWHAKVPSQGLVIYASGQDASLKFQISDVHFGMSSGTTLDGVVCTEDTFSSITIRWAADSAGNRRFLPSSNAAQRGIPASSPREQGIRIERSSGSVLVCFSSAVQNATLFDARGVAVAQTPGETTALTVPASRVKAGLYFLRVKRHGEVETIRVPVR
jgi:hypothetical protein